MIISASRRTDIPAFYSDWFMNRVRDGFFYRVNPFNGNQVSGFSLQPEHLDAICFWTKNPAPLMKRLEELDERGLAYYFQFTLNPYGHEFEPCVPPLDERIATFRLLAGRIGPERVIWRYDPVILSSVTPVEWHLEQAERIAGTLRGATRRLVFSFHDYYGKGRGRLHAALQGTGITVKEITAPEQSAELNRVACGFKAISDTHGLRIFTCGEEIDLSGNGIEHGACIDGVLIRELFGGYPSLTKDKNQRPACDCVESVEMGSYNTCPFRCSYCYATYNEALIESNRQKQFPDSPSLLGRSKGGVNIRTTLHKKEHGHDKQNLAGG